MARTLSVTDDESGVTMTMRVEYGADTSHVTHLSFDAVDGVGITAEHLLILKDFGLPLPNGLLPAVAPPVSVPAPRAPERVPADRPIKATHRSAIKRKNYTGGVPSDAALQAIYAQCKGSARRMSQSIGVSDSSIHRWLSLARARGVTFTAGAAETTTDATATP